MKFRYLYIKGAESIGNVSILRGRKNLLSSVNRISEYTAHHLQESLFNARVFVAELVKWRQNKKNAAATLLCYDNFFMLSIK